MSAESVKGRLHSPSTAMHRVIVGRDNLGNSEHFPPPPRVATEPTVGGPRACHCGGDLYGHNKPVRLADVATPADGGSLIVSYPNTGWTGESRTPEERGTSRLLNPWQEHPCQDNFDGGGVERHAYRSSAQGVGGYRTQCNPQSYALLEAEPVLIRPTVILLSAGQSVAVPPADALRDSHLGLHAHLIRTAPCSTSLQQPLRRAANRCALRAGASTATCCNILRSTEPPNTSTRGHGGATSQSLRITFGPAGSVALVRPPGAHVRDEGCSVGNCHGNITTS